MKRLILGGLSVLLMSPTPAVRAQTTRPIGPVESNINPSYVAQTRPFNLVFLAYRGYLRNQGIPGYAAFLIAYQLRRISAEDIVSSAVRANLVSSQVMDDQRYMNAVENHLRNLQQR